MSNIEWDHKNGTYQCFCPQRVLTGSGLFGSCFKINKWVSFTYSLDAFQTIPFMLSPRVSESLCQIFKSRFSIFYRSMVLQDIILVGFMCCGLASPTQDPRIGVLDVGYKSLIPQEKLLYFWDPSQLWVTAPVVGFCWECFSASPTCLHAVL